jgi:hypothetical protein
VSAGTRTGKPAAKTRRLLRGERRRLLSELHRIALHQRDGQSVHKLTGALNDLRSSIKSLSQQVSSQGAPGSKSVSAALRHCNTALLRLEQAEAAKDGHTQMKLLKAALAAIAEAKREAKRAGDLWVL